MANFAYYEQLEQKISALLSDKKFKEAFSLCKDSILKYPSEARFVKLKSKIEKAVEEENEEIIKNKLEAMKPLWKEEKYLEILKQLKDLLLASPNNSKLKSLYLDAEKYYKKQFEKLNEKFNKEQHKRLDEVLEKNPGQLTEELYILEKENPGNQNVKNLVLEYEDKFIEKKIKDKKDLLNSNKFDAIENFIDELRKIDKYNKRIPELEKRINANKFEGEITETKEFVYSGEKHLDTLMKLKKFDKAIKAAEEILRVDPKNIAAQEVLNSAQEKYKIQLRDLAVDSIEKDFQNLKAEYQKDKTKFIKI